MGIVINLFTEVQRRRETGEYNTLEQKFHLDAIISKHINYLDKQDLKLNRLKKRQKRSVS